MWPQTLEMSNAECRGMLRRLELESYSHIISVFRAQGSLSEPKAKLLEELRQMFHITQERHRSEVRRAANDEQLCTIAENVYGPNTWQEWAREGRRPYPLLPRIYPQTALTIVANDLAAKAYAENAKLPPPNETGANLVDAMRDQATFVALNYHNKPREPHVVMEEPFKVPDVPAEVKRATQKRKENEADGKPNKKRNLQQDKHQPLTNSEDSQPMSAEEAKQLSAHTMQQRYFYQQQQKHKQRMNNKKSSAANALHNHSTGSPARRAAAPAKSGRRAQKQLQLQQQKQLQQQQQQHLQQQQKVLLAAPAVQPPLPSAIGTPSVVNEIAPAIANYNEVQPHVEFILDEALKSVAATPTPALNTANPVKLAGKQLATTRIYAPGERIEVPTQKSAQRTFANSPVVFKDKTPLTVPTTMSQQQPQQPQQLFTAVKKYFVEERQPPTLVQPTVSVAVSPIASNSMTASASPQTNNVNVSTANLPLAPQIISVQQIPAPGPKYRPSSGILPPGTKLTPKQLNLLGLDNLPAKALSKQLTAAPTVRVLPYEQSPQATLSNLKTGKLSPQPPHSHLFQQTTPVQKYIVEERPPHQTIATVASATSITPLSSASTVNIIKNIPASSLNNTLITPLASSSGPAIPTHAATVFRKAPANINIKAINATTTAASMTPTTASSNPNVPQVLSNIKLTPATASSTPSAHTINIKQVPSSALRNFKICAPNGKVFLQPAKLPAGSIIHKLNNSNSSGTSTGNTGSAGSTIVSPTSVSALSPTPSGQEPQQRISLHKMQIVTPTHVISSAAGGTSSSGSSSAGNSTTTGAGGSGVSFVSSNTPGKLKPSNMVYVKPTTSNNNLIFVPTSSGNTMRTVTLAKRGPSMVSKLNAEATSKPNVLVIGSTTPTNAATTTSGSTIPGSKRKSHQLITEDTPIDFINMPIIVADNNGTLTHAAGQTKVGAAGAVGASKAPVVVYDATDWEMELDQASKVVVTGTSTPNAGGANNNNGKLSSNNSKSIDDVIIMDAEEEEEDQIDEQLNNRIVDMDEENADIEYEDMDLDQSIEMISMGSTNVTPDNTSPTKTAALSMSLAMTTATTTVATSSADTSPALKTAIASTHAYEVDSSLQSQLETNLKSNATVAASAKAMPSQQ